MTSPDGLKADTKVAVKSGPPERHCRAPFYLRGKIGTVVSEVGAFPNPSLLAFYKPGLPKLRLFRVRFDQHSLWPEYGPSNDSLFADIYENWLKPISSDNNSAHRDGGSHA